MVPGDFFAANLLVHTHLEKTAGSSFNAGLEVIFGADTVLHSHRLRDPDLPAETLESARVLTGHFSFGAHRKRFRRGFVHLAFVRDPFDRFVSQYNYIMATPTHTSRRLIAGMSFEDAMRFYIDGGYPQACNYACRHLGGKPRSDCKRAFKIIEDHYLMVAPHDRVDNVLERLAIWAGVTPPPPMKLNVGMGSKTQEVADRAYFDAHNQDDLALVAQVRVRFDTWLAEFDARLDRLALRHTA